MRKSFGEGLKRRGVVKKFECFLKVSWKSIIHWSHEMLSVAIAIPKDLRIYDLTLQPGAQLLRPTQGPDSASSLLLEYYICDAAVN